MALDRPITPEGEVAVVVAAHNRPISLQRLLNSLQMADVEPGTPLVISIDGGGDHQHDVREVAQSMDWPHGPFSVIERDHVGLVGHFEACGDLTAMYGSIVFLEDDLVVGPAFYRWAAAALASARDDERIAGVGLATPGFDGYRHLPFEPVLDGSDAIYMQVPWYDGMAWTHNMWRRFRSHQTSPTTRVHASLDTLGGDEWFPDAIRYLVETDRYYVLPRAAHASNTGAPGAHFDEATDYFQVPLTLRGPSAWRFHSLDDSLAVYDDHMELSAKALVRLVPSLAGVDLTIDLLGVRDLSTISTTHVLTTRSCATVEHSWGASMHPLVANLCHDLPGDALRLAPVEAVSDTASSLAESLATLNYHADRGRSPSTRAAVEQLAHDVKNRVMNRVNRGR